jgi:antitoxin HigA-1
MSIKKNLDAAKFMDALIGDLTLGKLLWAIRKDKKLAQKHFAKKLHISKSHLCDIEKGRKAVSPERALKFAKELKYSAYVFVSLSLQEMLDRAKIKMKVKVEAA